MFSAIFGSQWFVKIILILALLSVGYFILKPVKSAQHLAMRRLGMMIFVVFATVAVLFPSTLTRVANWLNIGRGTDLLLYAVVLLFFSSAVTAYRRDAANEKKLTALARTLALNNVQCTTPGEPELTPAAASPTLEASLSSASESRGEPRAQAPGEASEFAPSPQLQNGDNRG